MSAIRVRGEAWRKPRVRVFYQVRGRWTVHVEGHTGMGDWVRVIVAHYQTRDSANAYAKTLRRALGGG